MKVNFDGLRRNGAHAFNSLVAELNRHVSGEEIGAADLGDALTTGDIRDHLDNLRACLGTLLALEGDETDVKALEIDLLEFDPEGAV